MSGVSKGREIRLVVGGESRVELLPPEVAARAKARSTRHALVGMVVVAFLISGGGYAFASIATISSAAQLSASQATSTTLIRQQGDYIAAQDMQLQLDTAIAAQQVGTSTEIGWKAYLGEIQTSLPQGVTITGFTVESETPLQVLPQPAVPLQGPRVATLVFEATSPTLPDVKTWLEALERTTGFVDATPGTIEFIEDGGFATSMTLHIDSDAYAHRFAPNTEIAPTEESSE